jgi:ketopantoate hydroxymethyltransferase
VSKIAVAALKTYADEVRSARFPDAEHSYGMKPEEEDRLRTMLAKRK